MRQLQTILLTGVALFALTSTAQAQEDLTRDFSGVKSGYVDYAATANQAPMRMNVPPGADGQINGKVDIFGNGGSVEAIVNLNSNLVTFESGTATVGGNALSNSRSGIDILLTNPLDGQLQLEPFGSTIIPAGMGIFVQERIGQPAGGNVFTGYGQSQTIGFEAFASAFDPGETFASASFDFQVVTNGEDLLYSLSGMMSLSFDVQGNLVINENLTGVEGAGEQLNGFRTVSNNHHALAFDWQATNIIIPLAGLLSGYSEQVVTYRANVTSWTKSACINNGVNCIVAFSGFGDPVGRGGGLEEIDALSGDVTPFHSGGGDDGFVIGGLNFAPVTVSVFHSAAVPEPGTWALMISGFGLAGAALRRRRRVAYT